MISRFPDDWELINFFESEPDVRDPSSPWLYNHLEFAVARDHQRLHAVITPSYGKFLFKCYSDNELVFDLEFHSVDECSIHSESGGQYMLLRFPEKLKMKDVILFLRPRVRITGGNTAF
jgi:hypothetical protein